MIVVMFFTACEELDPREPGLLVPRTADDDPSVPSIFVNNTVLHSETFGNPADPMLVIIHGGPGSDYRYLLRCKAFAAEGFYVVFYDQRGSGLSKREPKSAFTSQVMIDDLGAVIAHYRTAPDQKILLLGQSWGGMLATAFINQNPDVISGAILGEPAGFVWEDIKACMKRARSLPVTSESLNDATYVDQFLTGKESDHAMLDYKHGLAFASTPSAENPLGDTELVPFWRLGAVINHAMMEIGDREKPDFTTNLNAFTTEILFVYSERNLTYGREYAEHVSSAYPSVHLALIEGSGHSMLTFETGWNNFFPIALTYLNEHK